MNFIGIIGDAIYSWFHKPAAGAAQPEEVSMSYHAPDWAQLIALATQIHGMDSSDQKIAAANVLTNILLAHVTSIPAAPVTAVPATPKPGVTMLP